MTRLSLEWNIVHELDEKGKDWWFGLNDLFIYVTVFTVYKRVRSEYKVKSAIKISQIHIEILFFRYFCY